MTLINLRNSFDRLFVKGFLTIKQALKKETPDPLNEG